LLLEYGRKTPNYFHSIYYTGTDKALKASYTPTPTQRRCTGGETPIAKTPSSRLRKTPKVFQLDFQLQASF